MSNNQNSATAQQDSNSFQPISEQEQMSISGGGISAAMPNRCKDDEYWDAALNCCIKKGTQPVAAY